MRLEVMQGGSGKWLASEIKETYENGRHTYTGRKWNGHVPKGIADSQVVIIRQLNRYMVDKPEGDTYAALGGGHILGVYNTESNVLAWGN